MTDLTALDELIKAVEAGEFCISKFPRGMAEWFTSICHSYHGDLNAAKALHDALLPGCSQYSIATDPTCLYVRVAWWPKGLSGDVCYQGEGWGEADPARAWLLAVLRAYRAQIGGAA